MFLVGLWYTDWLCWLNRTGLVLRLEGVLNERLKFEVQSACFLSCCRVSLFFLSAFVFFFLLLLFFSFVLSSLSSSLCCFLLSSSLCSLLQVRNTIRFYVLHPLIRKKEEGEGKSRYRSQKRRRERRIHLDSVTNGRDATFSG